MFSKIFNNKAKEDREFRMLVNEMKHQKFTNSSQVTEYIRKHHLSNKYQHISGVLTMQKGKDSWKYEGGISPKYYSRLCQELNLSSKNTSSKVKEFSPFSKLK